MRSVGRGSGLDEGDSGSHKDKADEGVQQSAWDGEVQEREGEGGVGDEVRPSVVGVWEVADRGRVGGGDGGGVGEKEEEVKWYG